MVGRPADGGSVVPDSTLRLCCGFCTVHGADPVMIALHSDSASVCAFCEHQVCSVPCSGTVNRQPSQLPYRCEAGCVTYKLALLAGRGI